MPAVKVQTSLVRVRTIFHCVRPDVHTCSARPDNLWVFRARKPSVFIPMSICFCLARSLSGSDSPSSKAYTKQYTNAVRTQLLHAHSLPASDSPSSTACARTQKYAVRTQFPTDAKPVWQHVFPGYCSTRFTLLNVPDQSLLYLDHYSQRNRSIPSLLVKLKPRDTRGKYQDQHGFSTFQINPFLASKDAHE